MGIAEQFRPLFVKQAGNQAGTDLGSPWSMGIRSIKSEQSTCMQATGAHVCLCGNVNTWMGVGVSAAECMCDIGMHGCEECEVFKSVKETS